MSSMDALQPTGLARRAIARMLRVPAVLALLICFWPQSGLARQDEFHCDECQPHDDCLTSPLPHTWGCYSSYDWECQVLSDGLPKPVVPEFSHAALVPTGPYQGKVLLWRNGNGSTNNNPTAETWMFDPNDPAKLRVIVQSLDSNIFCGDMSWSPTGWLIVAGGGREISMDEYANETYLFIPTLIGSPVLSGSCLPTLLNGSPWRTLGDMSIDRYYPTLITTLAGDIRTNIGNPAIPIPGGAAFVIGGEYDSPSHGHGSDWWQLLPPGAPDWSHTLRVEANNDGIPCGGAAPQPACPSVDERYVRRSVGTEPLPDPVIEYYPRALQLATIDEGELGTVKNILLANDVETGIRTGCSNASPQYCNDPGLSWIIKRTRPV